MDGINGPALQIVATPDAPDLRLRPWIDEDLHSLVAAAGDAELQRWTPITINNLHDAALWLERQAAAQAAGTRFSFAVLEHRLDQPDDDRLVGCVILKKSNANAAVAEVGYWTAAYARGRGVAPRALEALTRWAFDTFAGLDRLELLHSVGNTASCRVAAKTGYRFDRTLPPTPPWPDDGHVHVRTISR